MAYSFLSQSWFEELEKIRNELGEPVGGAAAQTKINVEVGGGPEGTVEAHYIGGWLVAGFAADAPAKLKLSYEPAKRFFVERDQGAAMKAFMSGQMKVEGDMSKLLALQREVSVAQNDRQKQIQERIRAITS